VYVCLCNGVNDHRIEDVVRAGAHSVDAVGEACAAGTTCGSCRPEIERIIARMEQRLVEAGHAR
jgi:bacterioferritin-associated ferredoxin